MTPRCRKDMPRTQFVLFLQWLCWGTDNQDVHALLHEFHQELLSKCSVPAPVLPGCYYRLQDLILMLLWSEGEATKLGLQQSCQDCKVKSRLGSECGCLTLTAEVTSHLALRLDLRSSNHPHRSLPRAKLAYTTQPTYSQTKQLLYEPCPISHGQIRQKVQIRK